MSNRPFIILITLLAFLLLLSACGGNGNTPNTASTASNASVEQSKSAAVSETPSASDSTANSNQPASLFPKVVSHLKGETTIKAKPSRIVTTNFVAAEHLIALGIIPYGTASLNQLGIFKLYDEELKNHQIVDLGTPLDYEAVVNAAPDLIISFDWDQADYDKLSAIAPTIVLDTKKSTNIFEETFVKLAEAINQHEAVDAFLTNYRKTKEETIAALKTKGFQGKTAIFMMASEKTNYLFTGINTKVFYDELGFKQIPELSKAQAIDLETLRKYDPDLIFVAEDYTNPTGAVEKLRDSAVWKSLTAVKNKHVYETNTAILGPLARGQQFALEFMRDLQP
ncbi:unnamed protein product [Aphanomyces euteiches]